MVTAAQDAAGVDAALDLDRAARRLIQQGLRNEGSDPGVPDGLFGPRRRDAIRSWQDTQGVTATGYLNGGQAEVLRAAGASAAGAVSARTDAGATERAGAPDRVGPPGATTAIAPETSTAPASAAGAPPAAANGVTDNVVPPVIEAGSPPQAAATAARRSSETQLPPKIQMDRYLMQAEERLQGRNLAGAKEALDRIRELQREHELKIPTVFHLRHAEMSARIAAEAAGTRARAAIVEAAAAMEFVRVPAGEFRMGSMSSEAEPYEQPVTQVRIRRPFDLGKYEATQSEWRGS
ncbi:MAG: SUMF1/EgtB/PvdO family nonheme iron enzyme [Chloroflexota bacterium]|nr:SUMF1/EgtB/PvdO family nonheme iron enzyme [Chloroflexota bacterium]